MDSIRGLNNNSDDSDRENEETLDKDATKTKKKRGDGKIYYFSEKYKSLELAKKAVEEEDTWSWRAKKVEKLVTKHYYRCNKVKQRCPRQCSTGLVLILKAESQEVELQRLSARSEEETWKATSCCCCSLSPETIYFLTRGP